MAMTPEELNELKKLNHNDLARLTYQIAHDTNETVKDLVPRVKHLEDTHMKISGAWAALVIAAGLVGFKLNGGGH